ncbi:MAG TPA: bL35 family ribosomal protein, partial [Bdellovibrionota bacterium]|nr:bL35 family ribosomal protein [Bdellovibrionota bacterium]
MASKAKKMKTNKAAAKRYKLTGTGKVKHKKAGLRHNQGHKD